ncbi:MAG TPA: rRNA maturation RNase YbeY, partial [Lachnospiraceae bacterium]|nr:rRNA maturation RNase YbeY [Lachnospiraceae bacterium]
METEKKPDYPWEEAAYCVCSRVLEQEGFPYDGEVELLLTTPDEIRAMNREHRDTDRVTDVLSFPMLDYEEGPADFSTVEGMELMYEDPETGAIMLGDIVINLDRVRE